MLFFIVDKLKVDETIDLNRPSIRLKNGRTFVANSIFCLLYNGFYHKKSIRNLCNMY